MEIGNLIHISGFASRRLGDQEVIYQQNALGIE